MDRLGRLAAALIMAAGTGTALAQSSVTVYGNLDTGFTWNSAPGKAAARTRISDGYFTPSQLGFKGSEDLGGGTHAIFNLQMGFGLDTGSTNGNPLFSRNAYAGLEGGFGRITLGRQWTLSDDWLIVSVYQPGWTAGSVMHLSEFDATSDIFNNMVKYVTPELHGWQAGLLYGVGEVAANARAGRSWSAGLRYAGGPFFAAGTFYEEEDRLGSGASNKLAVLGGSYALGDMKLRLSYADSRIGGAGSYNSGSYASARRAHLLGAGVDYMARANLKLQADILARRNTTFSNSSRIYRFMGTYFLSRRTNLVLNMARLDNRDGASEILDGTPQANQDQTGVGMIIRHNF